MWGSGGIVPRVTNLSCRWRRMVNIILIISMSFLIPFPYFVPYGQFVYFHFKSMIINFFFEIMHEFYIAYVPVFLLKVIFYLSTQTHAVVIHGFLENSDSVDMKITDVKRLKITDLGEFLAPTSRVRCRGPYTLVDKFRLFTHIYHEDCWIILRHGILLRCFVFGINLLKTKRTLLYLKTRFVPRCKHFSSRY